jgi:hypothetical protein
MRAGADANKLAFAAVLIAACSAYVAGILAIGIGMRSKRCA